MAERAAVAWVQTNVSTSKEARALGERFVRARLAACANLWPIQSVYWWNSEVQKEHEVTIHLKTAPAKLPELLRSLRAAHPYEVPYIEWGTTTTVDARYAAWVRQEAVGPRRGTRRRT